MALQERVVARVDDEIGELRREEAAKPAEALQLVDLLGDSLLELPVPSGELGRLGDDRVVVALHAQERADAG